MSKRLIVVDISPATDTHCGDIYAEHCSKMYRGTESSWCKEFNRGLGADRKPLRVPECIAAEKSEPDHGLF